MNFLQKLIEKSVIRITTEIGETFPLNQNLDILSDDIKTETYIQIIIEEFTLNVYNPIQLRGALSYSELVGKKVKNVIENDDQVILFFDNSELIIDIRDESYNGPEAIVLYGPNNLCVVWN